MAVSHVRGRHPMRKIILLAGVLGLALAPAAFAGSTPGNSFTFGSIASSSSSSGLGAMVTGSGDWGSGVTANAANYSGATAFGGFTANPNANSYSVSSGNIGFTGDETLTLGKGSGFQAAGQSSALAGFTGTFSGSSF